jgi:hypothetical protein
MKPFLLLLLTELANSEAIPTTQLIGTGTLPSVPYFLHHCCADLLQVGKETISLTNQKKKNRRKKNTRDTCNETVMREYSHVFCNVFVTAKHDAQQYSQRTKPEQQHRYCKKNRVNEANIQHKTTTTITAAVAAAATQAKKDVFLDLFLSHKR